MGLPLMCVATPDALPAFLEGLRNAGISTTLRKTSPGAIDPQDIVTDYICRRRRSSFQLSAVVGSVDLLIGFYADKSRWRWWSFPLFILADIPRLRSNFRLQQDAFQLLISLGARDCYPDEPEPPGTHDM